METFEPVISTSQLLTLLGVTGFLGLLLGFLFGRAGSGLRIEKAVEKVREEAEEEKMEISRDLNKELSKVRESIVGTVQAYSSVARTIQEKLPTPPELQAIDIEAEVKDPLKLEHENEQELEEEGEVEEMEIEEVEEESDEEESDSHFSTTNGLGSPKKVEKKSQGPTSL